MREDDQRQEHWCIDTSCTDHRSGKVRKFDWKSPSLHYSPKHCAPHTVTMGWFDYVSDLYSSVSIQSAAADVQDSMGKASGDFNDSSDTTSGGKGNAQQRGGAATTGGASTASPVSGTDEESSAEAEINKADAKGPEDSGEKGHKPGDDSGKAAAGQVGAGNAGPHGGPVGKQSDDEDEEDEGGDDEEEEEEDEPVDPKPEIEAGQ